MMTPPSACGMGSIPGGFPALVLFGLSLAAFVAQTEVAQYLQTTLDYQKPYLTLYLAHTSFILLFPLHLLLLRFTSHPSTQSISHLLVELRYVLIDQMDGLWHGRTNGSGRVEKRYAAVREVDEAPGNGEGGEMRVLVWRLGCVGCAMAGLMSFPSGLWYLAVGLTSMTSLTAIYNTSALFCYLFSVFLLPPSRSNSLQRTKLLAIVLAALGVLVVAFGSGSSGPDEGESNDAGKDGWFGNGIAVVGAASYGLYEVLYKKYFSLPHAPQLTPSSSLPPPPLSPSPLSHSPSHPRCVPSLPLPTLPFALHATFLFSLTGVATSLLLLPPMLPLHLSSLEPFSLPSSFSQWTALTTNCLLGIGFNGSFLILLGVWGPVVASVGNLVTILLVGGWDRLAKGVELSTSTLLGGLLICLSFVVLVFDMIQEEREERLLLDPDRHRSSRAVAVEEEERRLFDGDED